MKKGLNCKFYMVFSHQIVKLQYENAVAIASFIWYLSVLQIRLNALAIFLFVNIISLS